MPENELRSPTPSFPLYPEAQHFLNVMDGVSYELYRNMDNAIYEQRGNPQATADWSNPDTWIQERLSGLEQQLALKIWNESGHKLNPRFTRGVWYLSQQRHSLLVRAEQDILRITERGQKFLSNSKEVITEIDDYEGVLTILRIVAERGSGWRGNYLGDYRVYCQNFTTYRGESVVKGSLYDRLVNLVDRGYVSKKGLTYEITDLGLGYLDTSSQKIIGREIADRQSDLLRMTKNLNDEARKKLIQYISTMNPFKFEHLIRLLLEEMGYVNVETTSPVNDKGVDVVADIELGISRVREVVQVKRHAGNIQRPVLDALRGSLHRFKAVRGTIITSGGFSKGTQDAAFELGAAPITLIDGEKLVDLLIQYSIGVTKKSIEYMEFNESGLSQLDEESAESE